MKKQFCPNCGHEVKSSDEFCGNCGFKLKQAQPAPQQAQPQPVQQQPVQPQKKMSKRAKWGLAIGVIVVVLFAGFIGIGQDACSKENQADQIADDIFDPDADISNDIIGDRPKAKVTKSNAKYMHKMLLDSVDNDEQETSMGHAKIQLKRALMGEVTQNSVQKNEFEGLELVQSGRKWLFFPRYKAKVPTCQVSINAYRPNASVYVDGDYQGKTGQNGKLKQPMIFGDYTFKATATVKGKKINSSYQATINSGEYDVDVPIKSATFTIKSFPGATVYLDGKKAGKLNAQGLKKFRGYPVTNDTTMKVVAHVNGQKISSELDNDVFGDLRNSKTIKPEFTGEASKESIQQTLEDAFSSDDPNSDDFVGGKHSEAYKTIRKSIKSVEDSDGYDNMDDCKVKILSKKMTGARESTVSFRVTYTFNFDDHTNKQVIEWDGCVLQKAKNSDDVKIKTLGKAHMVSNHNTSTDTDDDDSDSNNSDDNSDVDTNDDSDDDY